MGGTAQNNRCDLTDEKQIAAAVQSIEVRHGKVDILINNAGVLTPRNLGT